MHHMDEAHGKQIKGISLFSLSTWQEMKAFLKWSINSADHFVVHCISCSAHVQAYSFLCNSTIPSGTRILEIKKLSKGPKDSMDPACRAKANLRATTCLAAPTHHIEGEDPQYNHASCFYDTKHKRNGPVKRY